MTQTLRTPTAAQAPTDVGPTIRVGLPRLPTEVVVRPRLYERLTAGSRGRLTVVQAPTGAGKTFGVAGWATQASVQSMIWLGDVGLSKDAAVFWGRLRADLLRLGVGPLSDPPPTQADDLRWSTWLGDLATALRSRGTSCLVILDDFPAGRCTRLGRQLATVSAQAADALRLVVICPTTPALDLSDALAGGYSHIEATELRLSEDEVAKLLAVRGVTVDPSVVAAVTARTFGWARGVELAAQTFSSSGVGDALDRLDAVVDALIEQEVLAELPAYGRELIVRTSVAADVPRGLAQAVLGAHVALAPELVTCRKGFIEPRQDGSFKCHPLLRRSALRRLDEDWPCLAGEARRAAAGWLIECGVRAAGLRVVAEVGDWNWLASALVTSLAVPAIVMGATEEVIATPVQASAVEKVEPLIAAAAAASRGDVESANVALARMTDAAGSSRADNPAYRLGDAVVRMSLARQIADHPAGLHWVTEGRRQWAHLGTEQHRAREVGWMLDGHEAAFLLWRGDLEAAAAVLGQPIDLSTVAGVEQVAGADCVGLLAWLEALRGNLTVAARHAAAVLTARPADCAETGVGFAQLAAAWVHLERSELQQARQRLLHGRRLDMSRHDPGLATARRLAEARLTTASGEPDMALRMLASVGPTGVEAGSAWLADRWCV
ncbi:MAG: hypothetical protein L0H24_02070, partial [Microlunatus sp.]|nr:hypothetical protein [Microlunatus sp.]